MNNRKAGQPAGKLIHLSCVLEQDPETGAVVRVQKQGQRVGEFSNPKGRGARRRALAAIAKRDAKET